MPRSASMPIQRFAELITSGLPSAWEARLRRADGVYRWFQFRALPHRDSAGDIVRWYALLTDIDDLKRAEALLAAEKRLLEMVASGYALSAVLEALCRLVEEAAVYCHCGVYLIDQKAPKCSRRPQHRRFRRVLTIPLSVVRRALRRDRAGWRHASRRR
jgi:hypothetical protein